MGVNNSLERTYSCKYIEYVAYYAIIKRKTKDYKEDLLNMVKKSLSLPQPLSIVKAQSEEIATSNTTLPLRQLNVAPSSEQMGWLFEELEILDAVLDTNIDGEETTT